MPSQKPNLRIMIIDDELELVNILKSVLEAEGHEVVGLSDSKNALDCITQYKPNILILDKMMPLISGDEIVMQLRSQAAFSNLPVIVVSGNFNQDSKIESLKKGASDYLVKPFSIPDFIQRVNSAFGKSKALASTNPNKIHQIGAISFNVDEASIIRDGQKISLTPTESKLLNCLITNLDQVQSRDALKTNALNSHNVTERTIDVHVVTLRKKLGAIGRSIKTVRGVGYRFINPSENKS